MAAIRNGRSIDTTMGYSPLPGLVMSTRSGDIDPAIPLLLIEQYGLSVAKVTHILNHESGLLGISGLSSDMRDLLEAANNMHDGRAQLAVEVYIHRLKAAIASMIAALDGIDALVFTDGVGLCCPQVREAACQGMAWCGVMLDQERNRLAKGETIAQISPDGASVAVLVVPNDEERIVALEGIRLQRQDSEDENMLRVKGV